jgi:hypothetical protein
MRLKELLTTQLALTACIVISHKNRTCPHYRLTGVRGTQEQMKSRYPCKYAIEGCITLRNIPPPCPVRKGLRRLTRAMAQNGTVIVAPGSCHSSYAYTLLAKRLYGRIQHGIHLHPGFPVRCDRHSPVRPSFTCFHAMENSPETPQLSYIHCFTATGAVQASLEIVGNFPSLAL